MVSEREKEPLTVADDGMPSYAFTRTVLIDGFHLRRIFFIIYIILHTATSIRFTLAPLRECERVCECVTPNASRFIEIPLAHVFLIGTPLQNKTDSASTDCGLFTIGISDSIPLQSQINKPWSINKILKRSIKRCSVLNPLWSTILQKPCQVGAQVAKMHCTARTIWKIEVNFCFSHFATRPWLMASRKCIIIYRKFMFFFVSLHHCQYTRCTANHMRDMPNWAIDCSAGSSLIICRLWCRLWRSWFII